MEVTEKIAVDHGLKKEEFAKICELLKRTPNTVSYTHLTLPTIYSV